MQISIGNKNIDKINISILLIIMSLFFIVKDTVQYMRFINCLYAAFLIAIGIVISKTIKFNPNGVTIFLGSIFTISGILEIVFILTNLNDNILSFSNYDIIFCMIIEVLQILLVYFTVLYSFNNFKIKNILKISAKMLICSLILSTIINIIFNQGIEDISLIMIIEYSINILILIIYSNINTKLNYDKQDKIEKKFLKRIISLFMVSRLIMVTLFIFIGKVNSYYIIRFISNISIYYLYRYIFHVNIKTPYIELNNINKELNNKTELLNYKNKRLISEMKKTQKLKNNLKLKDKKLRDTLNKAMNPTIIFTNSKEVMYANEYVFSEFKFTKNCSLEVNIKNKFDEYNYFIKCIDYVLSNKKETRCIMKSNDNEYYKVIFTPFLINEKSEGCLCIFINSTKEIEFEKEIIYTNLGYENFLESISEGIIILKGNNILYSNRACNNILKDKLYIIDFSINREKNIREEKYIIDGKEVYIEMLYSTYNKDKTSIVIRDITKRKMAEERLKRRKESYSLLIDTLPDGICLLDENLQTIYLNKPMLKMIDMNKKSGFDNYGIKEIIKLTSDEENIFFKKLKSVIQNNKSMLFLNKQILSKTLGNIEVEINALPFSIDGNSRYVMLIIKDLTDKRIGELVEKELYEKIEIDKVKTEFFTNMSHELKTPLNVIFSSNQLLESVYKSGKVNDYNENINNHIELVKKNSYRLQRLINNIIDLTKLESGFYKLNLSKTNIINLVEDLFMKIERFAQIKNINLVFDTESEEINMIIDESEIERVMLNLLSNCIKFTPENETISMNIYEFDSSIAISIRNSGVGIPKDKLKIIFDEFSQVDETLSRNTEGSGIGLSIVKKIIELHNGSITVDSEENEFTEFTIVLNKYEFNDKEIKENKAIYNIDEKINIEFSDIYY
ncbi:ATP-binding protein [Romboutsia sp. 1001713B170207_170306_H8]|uniref:ATP-binding protein n=2 Tax=unclassified Romboutsia TaxID=2626894 RepID=UPI00189ABCC9|nr:ATP-binding protein [Romboutsia sp. 1001713B170207_170306_H8]